VGCLTSVNDCWDKNIHRQIAEYSSGMLWRFVQPNASESEAEETVLNLTGLKRRDLELLSSIRFLLSDFVDMLINEIAPKIINRISKESVNEYITDRNKVCGRLDWQRTVKARATAGSDPSLFVYTRRAQVFDLPENRLFLSLLQQINDKARRFASEEYKNLTWYTEERQGQKWVEKVALTAYRTSRLLKNPYISKISSLHEISDKIIEITCRNRQAHYRLLADVGREYVLSSKHPLSYLKKVLDNNILEPLNRDTLYEIAVLFNTMQTFISEGWTEKCTGLIGGSNKTVSILEKGCHQVRVYTQKLPDEMKKYSAYGDIMAGYGLSEKLRRPDIILEFINNERKHFLIIEVKRSKRRSYLADGSYKLLGYLMDFKGVKNEQTNISGFLVGWDGILNKKFDPAREVHLFNWCNFGEGVLAFLNECII